MMDAPQQPGQGICIALEGTDGTGKSTQAALLRQRLVEAGHDVLLMKFPRYDEPSSYFVRQYLSGKYGSSDAVNPFAASLFFSLDRYGATPEINTALARGMIVLCDRFTGSNMIHQGAKFDNADERRDYFVWLENIEHAMLGIPRPAVTFVLTAPLAIIQQRLNAKLRSSASIKKDVHEADRDHIRRARNVSLQLCELFPRTYKPVDGVQDGALLPPEVIHERLWADIQPYLTGPRPPHPPTSTA